MHNFPLRKETRAERRKLACVAFLRRVERGERMLRDPQEGLSALARAAVDRADVPPEGDENDQDAAETANANINNNTTSNGGGGGGGGAKGAPGEESSTSGADGAGVANGAADSASGGASAAAAGKKVSDVDFVYEIGLDAGCGRPGGFGATPADAAATGAAGEDKKKSTAAEDIVSDGDPSLGGEIRARGLMYHALELYTPRRRVTQAILTQHEARCVKRLFNAKVVAALRAKEARRCSIYSPHDTFLFSRPEQIVLWF